MPLSNYGVLIGTFNHFERDNPVHFGQWYHGHIFLNVNNQVYECAVDVDSPDGDFTYTILGELDPAMFSGISNLQDGYHELPRNAASGAIDYNRSPFINKAKGCLLFAVTVFNSLFGVKEKVWVQETGDKVLDALEKLWKKANASMYLVPPSLKV